MRLLLALFCFTMTSYSGFAQINQDTIQQRVREKIDSMPDGFAISVAVLQHAELAFIGFVKEEGKLVPTDTRDSLFEIGSLTKVFTSTVLAAHVVEGQLALTEPVNEVFTYAFNNETKLSYGRLSNHTSGMYRLPSNIMSVLFKNPNNPYKEYSHEMLNEYLLNELKIEEDSVLHYAYSNLGAGVLAYALAKKNKVEFPHLLKATVTNKYKLFSTSYRNQVSYKGIGANGKEAENWEFNALMGAGGLVSNTNDLSKFIEAHFDPQNKVLALTRKETFAISDNLSIGLGLHILKSNTAEEKFWHNGGTGGYTSSISFRTTNQTGVIVLSNISAMHQKSGVIDELCFELLELLK